VAVYVRCFGTGPIYTEIPGVATFNQACTTDPADPGNMNVFSVQYVDSFTVSVQSDASNLWAITVTEYPGQQ